MAITNKARFQRGFDRVLLHLVSDPCRDQRLPTRRLTWKCTDPCRKRTFLSSWKGGLCTSMCLFGRVVSLRQFKVLLNGRYIGSSDRSKLGKCELQCVSPSQLATANDIGKTKYEPFGAYYSLLRSPTRELGATEQLGNKLTSLTLAIHGKHILAQLGAATPYPGRLVQYILPVKQPHPTIQPLLKSHN